MQTPEWLKPALWGAATGAVVVAVAGFSWGGWVTGSTADKMASDHARDQVVAALVPICLEQSLNDPGRTQQLAALEDAKSYKRRDMVMDSGWATMPGADEADRAVANACLEKLGSQF